MRDISVKALIMGNLLNPALLFAATWALAMMLRAPGESTLTTMQTLARNPDIFSIAGLVAFFSIYFAGYIAACLSSRALPLNATLSTGLLLLWKVALVFWPAARAGHWVVTEAAWLAPVFALLAGHFRMQQLALRAGAVRPSLRAGLRLGLPLLGALVAAMVVMLILAPFAPDMAIFCFFVIFVVAACIITPPDRRATAAWTAVGCAGVFAAKLFLEAANDGTLTFFNYFFLLSAIVARAILKPDKNDAAVMRPAPVKLERNVFQPAPRTDPAARHLWMRPGQQSDPADKQS